jgi:hypothetical protein
VQFPRTPLSTTQTVTASQISSEAVYKINYAYLAASLAVTFIGALLTSTTLLGWSNLGRDFSFSPFELAKAFDAPLLREVGSNMPAKDIVAAVGKRRIQYGAAMTASTKPDEESEREETKSSATMELMEQTSRRSESPARGVVRQRLVMLQEDHATRPLNGDAYD